MALVKMVTVEEEMKRNPELKEADLALLREWLKKQPHLPPLSDSELVLFLHSNYYRMEPTKTTIDTFFTVHTHVPEFFSNVDPLGSKDVRAIMKVVCQFPLPGKTPEGYTVIYAKVTDSEPSHYVFSEAVKLLGMITELLLWSEGTCPGQIILVDMDGVVFGHMARLSPMTIKKYFYYLQEALPVRVKGLHFMNTVPFMDVILNMIKPFMKKELMDVLVLHSNKDSLNQKIPLEILPNEAGGEAGTLKDLWAAQVKILENHRAWFQEQESRKVNEALRPGKAKNAADLFGVEGSFKKLDID
ncbi:alpha-tocopherol transfer protein-like [Athalia rosae]|uniref:alpha-tocopherol transfer protein-like n=1 Tax=Athalia rosae TaxID=37344 RepID=UPI0006264EC0|nr:alpha-tocopherol transfer protein-like [Athalia rosae]